MSSQDLPISAALIIGLYALASAIDLSTLGITITFDDEHLSPLRAEVESLRQFPAIVRCRRGVALLNQYLKLL
jgi:hypothetical protein